MTKRIVVLFAVLAIAAAGAFGWTVNVTGLWSIQDNDPNVFNGMENGTANHKVGIGGEFVFDHIGFGGSVMAGYADTDLFPGENDWMAFWDIRTYMSYHFLNRRMIDPFLRVGVGAFGDLAVVGEYNHHEEIYPEARNVNVAFYPYVGGGVALRLKGGLYFSGEFNWRPVSGFPPCNSMVGDAELNPYEVLFGVGYSFGSRRN